MRTRHRYRHAAVVVLALSTVSLVGCAPREQATDSTTRSTTSSVATTTTTEALVRRALWDSLGIDSYVLRYSLLVVSPDFPGYVITVRNGTVESIVDTNGDVVLPGQMIDSPTTIDDFFDLSDEERDAYQLFVEYDPEYGYPTHIGIDPAEDWYDDEYGYNIEVEPDRG